MLALVATVSAADPADVQGAARPNAVVQIDGMTCSACEDKLVGALSDVPGVQRARASFSAGAACLDVDGPLDEAAVRAAIEGVPGYTVAALALADRCPDAFRSRRPSPWDAVLDGEAELDVRVVSHGEAVDLGDHLVAGKFTVVDFGAPWCGPCHAAAKTLAGALSEHDDVAVRVVDLVADDAAASFALPAAKQHLSMAPGLPWFEVYEPGGKRVYRGGDVERALKVIERRRR